MRLSRASIVILVLVGVVAAAGGRAGAQQAAGRSERPLIPASRNAALKYWPAWAQLSPELRAMLTDEAKPEDPAWQPQEQMASLLDEHRFVAESLISASEAELCDFGVDRDAGSMSILYHLSYVRPSVRLLIAQARNRRAMGDHDFAEECVIAVVRLSNHLTTDEIPICSRMAAVFFGWAKTELDTQAAARPLSPKGKAELARALARIPREDPLRLGAAYRWEASTIEPTVRSQRSVQLRAGALGSLLGRPRATEIVGFPRVVSWSTEKIRQESLAVASQTERLAEALGARNLARARQIVRDNRDGHLGDVGGVWFTYALEKALDDYETGGAAVDAMRREHEPRRGAAAPPAPPAPAGAADPPGYIEDPAQIAEIRAALAATVTEINKAVPASDAEGYLRGVDLSNKFFAVEQKEWAKDLKDHPVEKFEMSALDEQAKFTPDRAEVTVALSWTMPTQGPAKVKSREFAVQFPALFVKRAGRWLYAGERLEELATPTALIRYPKGHENVARQIAEAFPNAKKHVDEGFGKTISRVEEIKLYDRRNVLQASVYPSMFQTDVTLSGWSEPGQSIKFLTNYAGSVQGWTRAFAHEYGHVATWEMGPTASAMPWWVQEGVAELASEEFMTDSEKQRPDKTVRSMASRGGVPAWADLSDYRTVKAEWRLLPYVQGHHFMGWLSEEFGRAKRNQWLSAMANGTAMDDAAKQIFGDPFDTLDARWRAQIPRD